MSINIYRRREAPDASIANAITAGTQGFLQGRQMRQQNETMAMQREQNLIANALTAAKIQEMKRKADALANLKERPGYFVDTVEGKLMRDYSPDAIAEIEKAKIQAKRDAFGGGSSGQDDGLITDKYDAYGNRKSAYDPRQKILQEQIKAYYKNLTGSTAAQDAMAEQGLTNISNIKERFGFDEQGNASQGFYRKAYRGKLAENKPWTAALSPTSAGLAVFGNIAAGKEGRSLAVDYGNLIQNLLRLRTGAAAPIQEQIDEFTRTGFRAGDDPEITFKKLQQGYQLLSQVQENLRPTPSFKDEAEAKKYGFIPRKKTYNVGAYTVSEE